VTGFYFFYKLKNQGAARDKNRGVRANAPQKALRNFGCQFL